METQTLEELSGPVSEARQRFLEHSRVSIESHPSDPRWQLACRIALSGSLGRSRLLSRFLLFIVDRHIRGRSHEMTEQQIGFLVFERAEGYDSNEDNIVRSYARNLRRRIEAYYAEEGQAEPLHLEIPRGGYVPSFTPVQSLAQIPALRPVPAASLADAHVESEVPGVRSANAIQQQAASAPGRSRRAAATWFAVLTVCVIVTVLIPVIHHLGGRSDEAVFNDFWRQIFPREHETFVVPSDDGLVIMQSLVSRPVPLASYISGAYRSDAAKAAGAGAAEILKLSGRRFTSVVDLDFASRLAAWSTAGPGSHMVVRYARDLRMDDLRTGNAVLIGSIESNPWIQLFVNQMNFQQRVSTDPAVASGLINTHPRPGESALYGTLGKPHTFGLVVFLPNLTRTGNVLVVGGLNTAGTQAATTFVTTPALMAPVLRRSRTPSGRLRPFELLVGADDFSSNAAAPHIIAERMNLNADN